MPYQKLEGLPASVRRSLPKHAQEIYRKAFNHAWKQYDTPKERRGNATREETGHRVAWAAVKRGYEKRGDRWVRKGR
jgi:cation transport regulator